MSDPSLSKNDRMNHCLPSASVTHQVLAVNTLCVFSSGPDSLCCPRNLSVPCTVHSNFLGSIPQLAEMDQPLLAQHMGRSKSFILPPMDGFTRPPIRLCGFSPTPFLDQPRKPHPLSKIISLHQMPSSPS